MKTAMLASEQENMTHENKAVQLVTKMLEFIQDLTCNKGQRSLTKNEQCKNIAQKIQ